MEDTTEWPSDERRYDMTLRNLNSAHLLSLFREWNNPDQPEQQMIEFLNRVPDGFCA
jgi:hypothetical protein